MSYLNGISPIYRGNKVNGLSGLIGFENYRIECVIGILPEERKSIQEIRVDLKVAVDISNAVGSDCVENTVDYAVLAEKCAVMARKKNYHLLETYAAEALNEILSFDEISWAWIRVKKPKGLASAEFTFVELERFSEEKK